MTQYEQYHVFSIPQALLDTLVPRNIIYQQIASEEGPRPTSPSPAPTAAAAASGARACNICLGVAFADVNETRDMARLREPDEVGELFQVRLEEGSGGAGGSVIASIGCRRSYRNGNNQE